MIQEKAKRQLSFSILYFSKVPVPRSGKWSVMYCWTVPTGWYFLYFIYFTCFYKKTLKILRSLGGIRIRKSKNRQYNDRKIIYKTVHTKQKFELQNPQYKPGWTRVLRKGKQFLLYQTHPSGILLIKPQKDYTWYLIHNQPYR